MKLLLALLAALPAAAQEAPEPSRYAEGQVWEYHTRPGEEASRLRIQRIEPWPGGGPDSDGRVYHVTVIGVRLAGAPDPMALQHLPVSRATLDASVTRLSEAGGDFPSPDEGIRLWREGRGGVFTIPMTAILAAADAAMARQRASEGAPGS